MCGKLLKRALLRWVPLYESHLGAIAEVHRRKLFLVSAARDLCSDSEVVELLTLGSKTCFDIAEAFSISKLRKCHAQELIPARGVLYSMIAAVSFDALSELVLRHELDQLCEDHYSRRACDFSRLIVNWEKYGLAAEIN